MDEATVKRLCIVYAWRIKRPTWDQLPAKMSFSFGWISPEDPTPKRVKPVAIPPRAWKLLKMKHEPTGRFTVKACAFLSSAYETLSWTKLIVIILMIVMIVILIVMMMIVVMFGMMIVMVIVMMIVMMIVRMTMTMIVMTIVMMIVMMIIIAI